ARIIIITSCKNSKNQSRSSKCRYQRSRLFVLNGQTPSRRLVGPLALYKSHYFVYNVYVGSLQGSWDKMSHLHCQRYARSVAYLKQSFYDVSKVSRILKVKQLDLTHNFSVRYDRA